MLVNLLLQGQKKARQIVRNMSVREKPAEGSTNTAAAEQLRPAASGGMTLAENAPFTPRGSLIGAGAGAVAGSSAMCSEGLLFAPDAVAAAAAATATVFPPLMGQWPQPSFPYGNGWRDGGGDLGPAVSAAGGVGR